jgi:hypothetical protein
VEEKLRKLYASTNASIVVAIEDEIYRFKYSSGSMEDHFNEFRLLIARQKSAGGDMSVTSVALAALSTFSDIPELNQLAKTFRLTSDLAKLTLESIESKFVIEARDLVDRDTTGFSATDGHRPCCHCERTNHLSDECWNKYPELMSKWMRFGKRYVKKKGCTRPFKKSGKSEDASATGHQVYTVSNDEGVTHYFYSVAGKTRAQEWTLDEWR